MTWESKPELKMNTELVDLGPTMELIQDLSLQSLFIGLNVSV